MSTGPRRPLGCRGRDAGYPSRWTPDSLEHPMLIDALEKEFDFSFNPSRLEKIETFRQIVTEIKDAQHGRRR